MFSLDDTIRLLLLLIFFASFPLCFCLLHGRRGRAPDEYLKRRHPGLQGVKTFCTSTRVHSVRTHSAFNRGVTAPLHRSSPCRYCASVGWFCRLPVPSEVNRKLRPRLPSSPISRTSKPIPSANRWPLRCLVFDDYDLLLAATRALGRGH